MWKGSKELNNPRIKAPAQSNARGSKSDVTPRRCETLCVLREATLLVYMRQSGRLRASYTTVLRCIAETTFSSSATSIASSAPHFPSPLLRLHRHRSQARAMAVVPAAVVASASSGGGRFANHSGIGGGGSGGGRAYTTPGSASLRSWSASAATQPRRGGASGGDSSSCRVSSDAAATRRASSCAGGGIGLGRFGRFAARPLAASGPYATTTSLAISSPSSSSAASRHLSSRMPVAARLRGIWSSSSSSAAARTARRQVAPRRDRQMATQVRDYFSKDDVREGYTVGYVKNDQPRIARVLSSARRRQVMVLDHTGRERQKDGQKKKTRTHVPWSKNAGCE